ncbi:MAG: carbon-nitrogen hydrolase family protein [Gammaproteobacteria bacterium]
MSRIACIQMASGPHVGANLLEAERLIQQAVAQGAGLVILPENFALMGLQQADLLAAREADGEGPIQDFLSRQARRHGLWIVGGTAPRVADDPAKVRAACVVYDDQGLQVARYDKLHLFDVEVSSGERYTESETIERGERLALVDTPFGRLGLAICYDLRFPELFRAMLDRGMELFAVPAAFTAVTGRAHWEVLMRARAIENLAYGFAAAQGGYHVNGRETYGDSMIVDPWGNVLDRLASGPGVVCAEVDLDRVRSIRRQFPAVAHRRLRCDG